MGIMGTVFNRTGTGGNDDNQDKRTYQGHHSLDVETILQPTDDNVITPINQNTWESIRSQSVVTNPTYFTKEQADNLKKLARDKRLGATQSKRAYKSLRSMEKSDTTVHKEHRKYQKTVAASEVDKQRSNASLARHLHKIRPQYVALGKGIEKSQNKADARIVELRAKIEAVT